MKTKLELKRDTRFAMLMAIPGSVALLGIRLYFGREVMVDAYTIMTFYFLQALGIFAFAGEGEDDEDVGG